MERSKGNRDTGKEYARRGQITLFILLALALIIIGGVVSYLTFYQGVERSEIKQIISGTEESRIIEPSIDICIYDIVKEGLQTLGMRGGYIDPLNTFPLFKSLYKLKGISKPKLPVVKKLQEETFFYTMFHGLPLTDQDIHDVSDAFHKVWENRSEL